MTLSILPPLDALEVDLLCFSKGGGEHPLATESTLLVKDDLPDGFAWARQIEIHMNLLGALISPLAARTEVAHRWPDAKLWIFDWRKGQKIAVKCYGCSWISMY